MITLRAMKRDEFPAYRDYFVVDYADEIVANYSYPLEKSRAIAARDLAADLPQTTDTPDHSLICIEQGTCDETVPETIGYLWYKLLDEGETVFILDFVLFEAFRRQGHGKAALTALERHLMDSGVEQIKLRVAADNKRALGLYERVGFSVTGYNMVKVLE
jgi:ribosomal protein S18 acetylase RimI-like enzyme